MDAVITCDATGCPESIAVQDVGISDHFLLRWEVCTVREKLPVLTVRSRSWRRLDIEMFRVALSTSQLCLPLTWPTDIDEMATLYNSELNHLLDWFLPEREFVRRPRPSDPWFDKECRSAKRLTRQLERAFSSASRRADTAVAAAASTGSHVTAAVAVAKAAAAKALWYSQRRTYHHLRRRKCAEFSRQKIETDQSDPQKLWRSVDTLLGRGRLPTSSSIDVESFMQFFTEKVATVRRCTSDAPPPVFSQVKSGVSLPQFTPLTTDDVNSAIRRLPDKSSAADPIPTSVLKQVADLVAPFIVELFNRSLAAGHFPT